MSEQDKSGDSSSETPSTNQIKTKDPEADREERRLRHWVIKLLATTFSLAFLSTIWTLLAAFIYKGRDLNQSMSGEFLSIIVEIMRIVVPPA